jgi:hypothetical protein
MARHIVYYKGGRRWLPLSPGCGESYESCESVFAHGSSVSQPHFEASVRMRFAFPKVGTWSPPGLPKLQSSIARVKTPCLEVFFIPLERS